MEVLYQLSYSPEHPCWDDRGYQIRNQQQRQWILNSPDPVSHD